MCSEGGSKLFVLSGRKPAGGCKQVGGPDICILRLFQRFVINHDRNDGSKHFCDPECVPHAIRTHKTGQKICGGHDNDHVAEKRNNKDWVPFPRPSMAPEVVTDTAEIRKPALMLFSALEPAAMVSG